MKKILLFIIVFCVTFFGLICFAVATEVKPDLPKIYIKAINPGYTIDGVSNVGEMIEIGKNSDQVISLAEATVGYTNSSGNYNVLYEFPEYSWFEGETILLRLASSPGSELANATYTRTLAMKGGLDIRQGGEVVDMVCWTSKDDCKKEFKSTSPTTLVRNPETSDFEHLSEYTPNFNEANFRVDELEEARPPSQCKGLVFSEILSYYDTSQSEQFIELHNASSEQILMDGCKIRYKNKLQTLSGIIKPEGYVSFSPDYSLTKNPTNSNMLELIDTDGNIIDELIYPNGQRKGAAYAFIGYDERGEEIWRVTYAPTPGSPNNYQEFKACEEGKIINEATGNCVKVSEVKTTICKPGQYLNLLTGRCKKIETNATKSCKEGYYLNPETNRCRKIKENTGANYNLRPETYEEKSSFIALYAVLGVVGLGLIYLIFEFRHEILKLWRKVFR